MSAHVSIDEVHIAAAPEAVTGIPVMRVNKRGCLLGVDWTTATHFLLVIIRNPKERHYVCKVAFSKASFCLGNFLRVYKNDISLLFRSLIFVSTDSS